MFSGRGLRRRRLFGLWPAAVAALLLASACGDAPRGEPEGTQPAGGPALTFTIANQRFAFAVVLPVDLVVVRTGPFMFWATPSYSARRLFLDERAAGSLVDTRVLDLNAGGTVDYASSLSWPH